MAAHITCQHQACPNDATHKAKVGHGGGCQCGQTEYKWCRKHLNQALLGELNSGGSKKHPLEVRTWEETSGTTETKPEKDKVAKRVGDADRNKVIDTLSEALAGGYLTAEEFTERSDQAWALKTRADLAKLVRDLDLPPVPVVPAPQRTWSPMVWALVTLGCVGAVVCIVMAMVTS